MPFSSTTPRFGGVFVVQCPKYPRQAVWAPVGDRFERVDIQRHTAAGILGILWSKFPNAQILPKNLPPQTPDLMEIPNITLSVEPRFPTPPDPDGEQLARVNLDCDVAATLDAMQLPFVYMPAHGTLPKEILQTWKRFAHGWRRYYLDDTHVEGLKQPYGYLAQPKEP